MEPLTKRILAIVLIAVIGVGIGVGAWWFLGQEEEKWVTPGYSDRVSGDASSERIKVGVLNDLGEIQGDHAWEGLWLAAYNINHAGGIVINDTTYYISVIAEDTDEASPQLDVTKGVAAAKKIITVDKADFLMGGFRTEALKSYVEVVMDNKKLFFGTGAATDSFCENVVDAYSRYKYFFRTNPHNSSAMGKQNVYFLIYLSLFGMPNAAYLQGIGASASDPYYNVSAPSLGFPFGPGRVYNQLNITKIGILREDLDWTIPFAAAITGALAPFGLSYMDIPYPVTATSEQFTSYINDLNGYGAQVVIPIISAQGGQKMMTAYKAIEPNFLIAGVDVQSQTSEYWTNTLGACEYEVYSHGFSGLNGTNVTPLTQAFFDQYNDVWGHSPLYTGSGCYDALYILADAITQTQSLTNADLITYLETRDRDNPRINMSVTAQKAATTTPAEGFTGAHDVVADWPFGVIAYGQWQPDGKQYCIPTGYSHPVLGGIFGLYPDWLATSTLMLPPWGIWGLPNVGYPS